MIDIAYCILVALAIYKGYSKGIIIAIASVAAYLVGLAAALKLSATVAAYMAEQTNLGKWLPAASFFIVFMAVVLLVRMLASVIQKTFETLLLGWANRLAGAILFVILYTFIYSIFLFYAVQLQLIKPAATQASICYAYIQPIGPKVISGLAVVVPWFKNMFAELAQFFEGFANKS